MLATAYLGVVPLRDPMESERPARDAAVPTGSAPPADPARAEWRALVRLRDRVETAAREIERLRAENAALAQRVAEAQESVGSPDTLLEAGETPESLRQRVEAFIAALDRVLAEPPEADLPDTGADAP